MNELLLDNSSVTDARLFKIIKGHDLFTARYIDVHELCIETLDIVIIVA